MNLLVLRLATINAEEQVQERLEAAEARRQAVHLEGDVISPNSRLFVPQEKPEQLETISVCSCACLDYKIFHTKRTKNRKTILQHEIEIGLNNSNFCTKKSKNNGSKKFFSMPAIFTRSVPVKRLLNSSSGGIIHKIKRNNNSTINNEIELNFTNNIETSLKKHNRTNKTIGDRLSDSLSSPNLKRNSI